MKNDNIESPAGIDWDHEHKWAVVNRRINEQGNEIVILKCTICGYRTKMVDGFMINRDHKCVYKLVGEETGQFGAKDVILRCIRCGCTARVCGTNVNEFLGDHPDGYLDGDPRKKSSQYAS